MSKKQSTKTAQKPEHAHDQSIEDLQRRYNELNTRKIQAETNLKNAQRQLEQYQAQAREKYGTDDVAELQKRLEKMKEDNERKRSDYQQNLDRIEQDLNQVDAEFSITTTSSEDESV